MDEIFLPAPRGKAYGYITTSGEWASDLSFTECSRFINGFAQFSAKGLVGLIDKSFRVVLEPRYREIRPFLGNLICTLEADREEWFVRDRDTNILAGPLEWCGLYSEGFLRVKNQGSWFFLDSKGEVRLTFAANWVGDLQCQRIRVVTIKEQLYTSIVNSKGEPLLENLKGVTEDYSEDRLIVRVSDDSIQILDENTNSIGALFAEECGTFSEGLCPFAVRQQWGYFNLRGEIAIPLQYNEATEFSEGRAAVCKDGRWGFIGIDGMPAFAGTFDFVEDFIDGYALVQTDGRCYYIGRDGQVIWSQEKLPSVPR